MSGPARRSVRHVLGRVALGLLLGLLALPAYLTVAPAWRLLAVRLACAIVVGIGCAQARRWARAATEPETWSPLDVPPPPPAEIQLDPGFRRLCDDVGASLRSRRYFDVVLWPRLLALAGPGLVPPPVRPILRRWGPSRWTIEALVTEIERRA